MNDEKPKPKYWDIPWSITEIFVVFAVSLGGFALIGILLEILKPIGDTKHFLRIILTNILIFSLPDPLESRLKDTVINDVTNSREPVGSEAASGPVIS